MPEDQGGAFGNKGFKGGLNRVSVEYGLQDLY